MAKSKTDALADTLSTPTPRVPIIPDTDLLSTGCTLLNMAFSGRPFGGVPKGSYVSIPGASGGMKTWLTFCLFAEAALNPEFDAYTFVHDDAEHGALMDVGRFFGQSVADRLEPPWKYGPGSVTAQDFYHNVEAKVKEGPCIYVLDSMDAVKDDAQEENFAAKQYYHETGKGRDKIKGSMGMGKAKTNSDMIARIANSTLRSNGSILVIISQTRDLVGAQFPTQTYGGGRALKFYSHLQAWTKVKAPLKKHYKGKDREIGSLIEIDVQKNRVCGWEGKVPLVTFLKGSTGSGACLDDVGSNLDYLLDEKHWKKPAEKGKKIQRPAIACDDNGNEDAPKQFYAPEFEFTGTKEQLVRKIQEDGLESHLAKVVAHVWREIAAGAAPQRKPRY